MATLLIAGGAIFLWSVLSARLEHADLTAPIAFVAVGGLSAAVGLVDVPSAPETLKPLVEITLVWVLFSDAAGVPFGQVRRDLGRCLRLLAVGLPLTVVAGWALADVFFPGLGGWLALLVAAALAPTDAALGLPVVTNPAVPSGVRRLITVESGLNDGIVTPVVVFALAGAAAEGAGGGSWLGRAFAELGLGVVVGVCIGLGGGWLLQWARARGWADEEYAGIAVLALPSRPTPERSSCTGTASSPHSAVGSPSVRQRDDVPRPNWCSWSRPAVWSPCSSGWCSARWRSRSWPTGPTS